MRGRVMRGVFGDVTRGGERVMVVVCYEGWFMRGLLVIILSGGCF